MTSSQEQRIFEATVTATLEELIHRARWEGHPEIAEWLIENTGFIEEAPKG